MDEISLRFVNELSVHIPGLVFEENSDIDNSIDLILKALVEDVTDHSTKCNLLNILELHSTYLFKEVSGIELVLSTVKNVFNSTNNSSVQAQILITTTAILLESSARFSGEEFDDLFSQHINHLLDLVNCINSADNVYVRSIAADSLLEMELCYPLLLKPCFENIYNATLKEMSAAHQQYSALLSLIGKHCTASKNLSSPLWDRYPEVVFKSKFLNEKNNSFLSLVHGNNQLVSFLVDELSYCNSEGVVWITQQIIEILLHNTELRGSCGILKPLFFNSVKTYNCALFQLLLYLERVFGRELFGDDEHRLLLKQLLLNCSHSSLHQPVVHLYLQFLSDYLSHQPHQLNLISNVSVILPSQFDEPETQLKKVLVLCNVLKHKNGSSTFLLKVLRKVQKQTKSDSCSRYKLLLMKTLYKYFCDYDDVKFEDIGRIIIIATTDDITTVPFVLYFIRTIQYKFPASELPSFLLTSLINVYTQADCYVHITSFKYVLDVFQEALSQKCSLDHLKVILIHIHKHVLSQGICEIIPWSLGHKILKLCYVAMKEFDTSCFFFELSNVLMEFVSKSNNDDIQDRAKLYLRLLQSLSDKKLKTILHIPKQQVPCFCSDDKSCSAQSCIQKLEKPIVCLLKMDRTTSSRPISFFSSEKDIDIVSSYQNFISSNETFKKVTIPISLKISPEYSYLQCIEALAIFIDVPKSWGKIDPILAGHIKEDILIDNSKIKVFNMICYPDHPQPIQGQVRAQFSLDNKCHMCSLDAFEIALSDFFHVIPIDNSSVDKKEFFKALWKRIDLDYHSVYFFDCPDDASKATVKREFESFLFYEDDLTSCIGIFLPPRYHVLMKCNYDNCKITMNFVTDCLSLLGLFNSYFKTLFVY